MRKGGRSDMDAAKTNEVDAFITYAQEDSPVATHIETELAKHGLAVLHHTQGNPGDANSFGTVEQHIDAARVYLFVMSPHSLDSRRCLDELDTALGAQKRVIPIRIAPVSRDLMPSLLQSIQWLDLVDRTELPTRIEQLANVIRRQGDDPGTASMWFAASTRDGRAIALHNSTGEFVVTLQVAREICRKTDPEFDLSFTSLLLALTVGNGDVARLMNYYFGQESVSVAPILESKKLEPAFLVELLATASSMGPVWSGEPPIATASAMDWLAAANRVCGTAAVDTRHLLAAMIYELPKHIDDLNNYHIMPGALSRYFLGYIAQVHPEELGHWEAAHRTAFPSGPEPQPVPLPASLFVGFGLSPHIANDLWTIVDALGYSDYARVLYRFLTNERTEAPLVVGVQAPWGGGKSSLMRMVQGLLDPEQVERARRVAPTVLDNISLTLGNLYRDVTDHLMGRTSERKLDASSRGVAWTVWFNAWKYESTNQVWAGLADAIICQITGRMTAADKERFFLRLNLRRLDAGKVRAQVLKRLVAIFVGTAWKWLLGAACFAAALVVSLVRIPAPVDPIHWALRLLAPLGSASLVVAMVRGALKEWKAAKDKPPSADIASYLSIPDYGGELGFVHTVESDIRRVLACLPKEKRLVIFIDDLDRCSPTKVSQVVEGVNLFLAGDFDALFVMGMDSEMVAAALNVAHKDVAGCLPRDVGVPVGWHFMDKFVQLPFIVPPPTEECQRRYLDSLYADDARAEPAAPVVEKPSEAKGDEWQPDTERTPAVEQPAARVRSIDEIIDEGFARFNDSEPEIRDALQKALGYFHGNPRELKRFVNVYRLHYTLWWTLRQQNRQVASLDQLLRWTVFIMKWPDVVRWVYRGRGMHSSSADTSRLRQLEQCADVDSIEDWQRKLKEAVGITKQDTPWCENRPLYEFFRSSVRDLAESERLSAGEGKGLW